MGFQFNSSIDGINKINTEQNDMKLENNLQSHQTLYEGSIVSPNESS